MNEATAAGVSGGDIELEDVVLDLDVTYTAQQMEEEAEGTTTSMLLVTAQDGAYVYAVSGIAFGDDPTDVVESIAKEMQAADTSEDAGVFHEDGTSMGGLWAKLPSVERVQEQVPALTFVSDITYLPMQERTPAA